MLSSIKDVERQLKAGEYDFIDLGAGSGESMLFCQNSFGFKKGLGIDKSASKQSKCNNNDVSILFANVFDVEIPPNCVRCCSMMDFLEHLPNITTAEQILARAGVASSEFLFIRHPSFEDIDYLADHGLKLDWTDWTGHKNMMTLNDFIVLFEKYGWHQYTIIPRNQIIDSTHRKIIPFNAPSDTVGYDIEKHGAKALVYFNKFIWSQFDIFVKLNERMSHDKWVKIIQSNGFTYTN